MRFSSSFYFISKFTHQCDIINLGFKRYAYKNIKFLFR